VHWLVALLQAMPVGQSAEEAQPHLLVPMIDSHLSPAVLPAAVQSLQTPDEPQAELPAPGAQEPVVMPLGIEQQPVLQVTLAEQVKLQRLVLRSHPVAFEGQSATPSGAALVASQPQKPPPLVASHWLPAFMAANCAGQLTQAPPLDPHSVWAVPATQTWLPAASQQPLLQGL
jgi:hypothetical protein